MKYEEAIKSVGGCGRYQLFMLNLLYIATIFDGLQIGCMVFIVPTIKHRTIQHEKAIKSVGGCGRYQLFMLNLLYISTIFDGLQIGCMVFIVQTIKHRTIQHKEAIKSVGGCGRYQIFMLNLLYISTIFDGLQIGCMVFIVPTIKHRCAIPDLPNDTYEVQNEDHAELIKEYIPEEMVDGKPVYSKCHLYANKSLMGNQTLSKCNSWVYDKSIFETTITSDFNLVCGKEWLAQQVYTVTFAGDLVAMLICGWLSDRFGRKSVIISSLILQGTAGVLSSQMKNINAILILRFLNVIGGSGSFIPSVVLGAEISSIKKRTTASIALHMYFTFGYFILTFLTYYIRSWTILVLTISLPLIVAALLYIWMLPESPRWLLTVKKKEQAVYVLNKIAKINGSDLHFKSKEIEISEVKDRTVRLWKIFTIPDLLKRTLILIFNWCVVSFVYYGLMLNTENLSGNFFLNFFFGALVEIPAYITCIVLLNRVGRKKLYIAFMIIGGIGGVVSVLPRIYASEDLQWTTTALATLSRLGISGAFTIIYLHTCELYPTCVRNGALGLIGGISRFGGAVAPYIMIIRSLVAGRLGETLPLLIMGVISLLASVSYFFLPETNNRPMEDTFDDVFKPNFDPIRKTDEYQLEVKTVLDSSI